MSKIRVGFVSNSSSSSFICDVCGEETSGIDLCMSDCGFVECENGHVFCESEKLKEEMKDITKLRKYAKKEGHKEASIKDDEEFLEWYTEYYGEDDQVTEEACPICQFKSYKDSELVTYLLKRIRVSEEEILDELKDQFESFDKFDKYINKKN